MVVEKVVAIHDIGRVINPLGARQVEGGIIQALGHTFSEARLDDPLTGRCVLTRTLDAYKLPTIADARDRVRVRRRAGHAPDEPRLEGLGEPPIVPTAAAIGNAIRDATGADVTSLPITREEILRALREAESKRKEPATGAA